MQSVNPVRNLYSLCGFLLKSAFLESMCFVGQQISPNKGLLVLFTAPSVAKLWLCFGL